MKPSTMKSQRSRTSRVPSPSTTSFSGISNYHSDSYRPITRAKGLVQVVSSDDYRLALRAHYVELGKYLASYLASDIPKSLPSTRAQRLEGLTVQQFHELSTDIYDELVRRKDGQVPFLPLREDLHSKRNQARKKLANLRTARFENIAGDMYFETERRFPDFKPADPPLKNTFNSNDDDQIVLNLPTQSVRRKAVDDIATLKEESNVDKSTQSLRNIYYLSVFKTHFLEFARYLKIRPASSSLGPSSRMNARSQLAELTIEQFHELSTDVFDELFRRETKHVPFLPARSELHIKRNQLREKLASFSTIYFENICGDVHFEIGRRLPDMRQSLTWIAGSSSVSSRRYEYPSSSASGSSTIDYPWFLNSVYDQQGMIKPLAYITEVLVPDHRDSGSSPYEHSQNSHLVALSKMELLQATPPMRVNGESGESDSTVCSKAYSSTNTSDYGLYYRRMALSDGSDVVLRV